jgi:hypothetical protein
MQRTLLGEIAERLGTIVAFIPSPPNKKFHSPPLLGHLEITAMSISDDEGDDWVRGWRFSLADSNARVSESRYLDRGELDQIKNLMQKWSDQSVKLAFEFRSLDGIVFKKFQNNQRVTFLAEGRGQANGLEGPRLIGEVVEFLEDTAKMWE